MATQSPFSFLDSILIASPLAAAAPMASIHEVHQRAVLFINHVLMQEPEAMERMRRQKAALRGCNGAPRPDGAAGDTCGPVQRGARRRFARPAPGGDRAVALALAQSALRGDKPAIRIEGDVQLAAEINWLVDHVRWDVEEDLARLMGDSTRAPGGPGGPPRSAGPTAVCGARACPPAAWFPPVTSTDRTAA